MIGQSVKILPFLHASSIVDQVPSDNVAVTVAFENLIEGTGISISAGAITILEQGLYFINVNLRYSATGATKAYLDFYFNLNGTNINNSGSSVDFDSDVPIIKVVSFSKMIWLKNGDVLRLLQQTEDFNQGTGLYKASHTDVPVTPSAILTMYKVV